MPEITCLKLVSSAIQLLGIRNYHVCMHPSMLISALPGGVVSLVVTGGGGTIQVEASVQCFIGGRGDKQKTSSLLK